MQVRGLLIYKMPETSMHTTAEIKRGAKAKADSKTGAKAASKAPRTGYHLFLGEQLEKMTGEDRRNYHSIVSRKWKEIKEDLHTMIGPDR